MRRSFLTALLLATVAISTSDVLPIVSIKQLDPELDNTEDQVNDNTLTEQMHDSDISNNVLYKVSIGARNSYTPLLIPEKSSVVYVRDDNRDIYGEDDHSNKKDKYADEGFRKEQWHNYPRQLDRLQKYLYRHHEFDTNSFSDPDEPEEDKDVYEIATNEIQRPHSKDDHDALDTIVDATSPLLILKIRLAYLKNDLQNSDLNEYTNAIPIGLIPSSIFDNKDQKELDHIISAVKVKREGISSNKESNFSEKATDSKKTVNKRIFSLWSRLQSLSHKGHELHHRRHLHAFYGFPEDDGSGSGGTLTAETRASFVRPPGSPLRWG